MAGVLISDYAVDTDKWAEMVETQEKQRKGFIGLSLTNYDNSSLPAIEAASYLECAGALYGFSSEEAIGGSPTTANINYIVFDPTPRTLAWSIVAPTWSAAKNGWYDAGAAKRYIGGCYYVDTPTYTEKWVYQKSRDTQFIKDQGGIAVNGLKCKILEIGTWNMDSTTSKNVAHGLTKGNIWSVTVTIREDTDTVYSPIVMYDGTNHGGTWQIGATYIALTRFAGGFFDSADYDTMGDDGNRGWITIWYRA